MKLERALSLIAALAVASCGTSPSSPTAASPTDHSKGAVVEGQTGAAAIATTRMRLRRVGGGDIKTGLVTGQVIPVPVNVNLDVWAEIARLETDRARLVVDWGNGNIDHTGCGSCRLENVYRKEGRYTLTATIVDLNAPSAAAVSQAIVTIDVLPPTPAIECAAVGTDFESVALGAAPPALQAGGATYGTIVSGIVDFGATLSPYLTNKALQSFGSVVTVTFDSDKTSFASGIVVGPFGSGSYQAFNEKGVLVASGNLSFSAIPGSPDLGAYPSFSSPAPFRSVVFSFGALGFMIDNVAASCK